MLNLERKQSLSEALVQASETGDLEALKSTLSAGVDVDATNVFGSTALMRAASDGHVQMVRLLLSYGADPNRARNDKFTPLALAAFFGHQAVVKCLVEHGADPNAGTRVGTSAQMWASARTYQGVARYLGDKGNETLQPTRTNDPTSVSINDPSTKEDEYRKVGRSFSSVGLNLRLALSSLVLLFVVGAVEVILEHRQAAPATTSQAPQLTTESAPAMTMVEQTATESPAQPLNASTNLNHSENLGTRNSSAAKTHNRVAQSRVQENDVGETSITIAEEPKIKAPVASRELTAPPVKATNSRSTSPTSRSPSTSTQLISSPNSSTKNKVIQWP
jgi:uncharacterized protein